MIVKTLLLYSYKSFFHGNFNSCRLWHSTKKFASWNTEISKLFRFLESLCQLETETLQISWNWLIAQQNGVEFKIRRTGITYECYVSFQWYSCSMFSALVLKRSVTRKRLSVEWNRLKERSENTCSNTYKYLWPCSVHGHFGPFDTFVTKLTGTQRDWSKSITKWNLGLRH